MVPTRLHDATCPSCGHAFTVTLVDGPHLSRVPDVRKQLVAGTFQAFACPACGATIAFEAASIFMDFERREYLANETRRSATWQAAVARHQTLFHNAFELGPPIAQELAQGFTKRVVYGLRAMREKLVLWDAGLSDVAVEAVKGDLLAAAGEKPRDVVLRIAEILDGGHLLFAVFPPTAAPPAELADGAAWGATLPAPLDFATATAAQYALRADEPARIGRDYPWLENDWLVDLHDGPSYLYR